MTTTLRPNEPERRLPDDSRSRTYDICVNSRVVGGVRLRSEREPTGGSSTPGFVGRMDRLVVEESERRRGRATVAALAGEEVLRGWGCHRAWLAIPGTAHPARQLALALGYRETNRHLTKGLAIAPELPDGSSTRPLTEAEFPDWSEATQADFVAGCVAQGLDRDFAEATSRADFRELLPHGADSTGMLLRVLEHEGEQVGTLWLCVREAASEGGYVYGVTVAEAHRGHGHGRTLMHIAEREVLAAGGTRLALNVFTDNAPAGALYDSLGYEPLLAHFNKPLL